MTQHIDDSLLQDFQEGLLEPEVEGEVRGHLDVCSRCREELKALGKLIENFGDLPTEAQPSRDLWPQIEWRMEGSKPQALDPEASGVPVVPGGREHQMGQPRIGRRISLPAWQLLAASIALVGISGGSVWAVLSGRAGPGGSLGPRPGRCGGPGARLA